MLGVVKIKYSFVAENIYEFKEMIY